MSLEAGHKKPSRKKEAKTTEIARQENAGGSEFDGTE
jgi:hypothetical protein